MKNPTKKRKLRNRQDDFPCIRDNEKAKYNTRSGHFQNSIEQS